MATVNHFLDTRKTDNGFGIIKLRVTHNREQKDYSTKLKIPTTLYDKIKKQGSEIDGRVKDLDLINYHNLLYGTKNNNTIYSDGFIVRAKSIIKKLGNNFNFDTFKHELDNYGKDIILVDERTDILKALIRKSDNLKSRGQITHGTNFGLVAKSFSRFVEYLQNVDPFRLKPKKNFILRFEHIDSDFLNDWSLWMKKYGKSSQKKDGLATPASETTIGIYSRTLKIIFNDAIASKIIDKEIYPFGKNEFIPPAGKNIKKALSKSDIDSIKIYQSENGTLEQRSLDLWLFSYFGNGMNFTDILHLKWSNISDNKKVIVFQRQKTKGNPTIISIKINERMWDIINRWGNERKDIDSYIFPMLNDKLSIIERKAIVHQTVKLTNKYMNKIGEKMGIKSDLNTYHARHSFATQMMRNNAPLQMIKEKLGHKRLSTTESYLGSFEEEAENEYIDKL
ncbi:tyrosine-type recombinase/integrase [Emticicia agri]|uniref:Tyr recombinase domain-containing protein n=1 Tax=Emticicia agri TaxID=2492393 RepID=A0A4Q5LXI6_9BACT|nr:tyrosine-type recombinase/integrase [Emticicia agri]RYU94339.1 hypothetical protein EWM59_17595 [Emticicia agri]